MLQINYPFVLGIILINNKINENGNSLKSNGSQKSTILKDNNNETFKLLADKIMSYIVQEKPNLNPGFSVQDICTKLNTPRHHVQYCMNVIFNKKFTEFKNELRVKYAIELLKNDSEKNKSFEGIGNLSGFASNSNFYSSFKEVTGYTPKAWLENNKDLAV